MLSRGVRYWVADNSNTPIKVLKKLSKDKNIFVRMTADCNIRRRKTVDH